MNEQQWEQLKHVMTRLAEGDRAAVVTLYVEFGPVLAGVVRRHLARFGARGVTRDDLDGMVLDVCFAIGDVAVAWDASSHVPPWTWAEKRIAKVVNNGIGQYADELDDTVRERPTLPPTGRDTELAPGELLGNRHEPMCRLLRDAFDEAGVSERDRTLLLEAQLQASLGDPSPANTVAMLFDLQPATVRQAVKRAKDRLRTLARTESRFAPLADLALLA